MRAFSAVVGRLAFVVLSLCSAIALLDKFNAIFAFDFTNVVLQPVQFAVKSLEERLNGIMTV